MLQTFTIPVKPHVRKYLLLHLGAGYKLSQLDPYGRCLKLLLQLKQKKSSWDGFMSRYTAEFDVSVLGKVLIQKRLSDLNSKQIIDFNNFVEAIIKEEFFGVLASRRAFGLSQHAAIQAFRAKYNFEDEDISFETLKKAWQREKRHKYLGVPAQKIVSVCPPVPHRLAA